MHIESEMRSTMTNVTSEKRRNSNDEDNELEDRRKNEHLGDENTKTAKIKTRRNMPMTKR